MKRFEVNKWGRQAGIPQAWGVIIGESPNGACWLVSYDGGNRIKALHKKYADIEGEPARTRPPSRKSPQRKNA